MMWRWHDAETKRVVVMTREEIARECGIPIEKVDEAQMQEIPTGAERRGYCGLAGKPTEY